MTLSSKQSLFLRILPWLIIAFGIILRLDQYLFNRSLWLDELCTAINFDKTLLELLTPSLDYRHSYVAPPGFVIITKLLVNRFGTTELVFRFFPLLCDLASLVLFYKMAKAYISETAVPVAVFLFAISDTLIFYSSEFHQYSSDVTITVALFLLLSYLHGKPLDTKKLVLLAVAGIIAIGFSHPSAFILATIGTYLFFFYLREKQWQITIKLSFIYMLWLLTFFFLYLSTLRGGTDASPIDKWFIRFWVEQNAFMPFPFSMAGLKWMFHNYITMFGYPGSLRIPVVGGWLFLLGWITLLLNRKDTVFLFTLPFLITVLASFFLVYPFSGRVILFLVPLMYLGIAEGIANLQVNLTKSPHKVILTVAIQIVLMIHLFNYSPFTNRPIYQPRVSQETKPVFEYVQTHRQPADIIYVYHWAEPALRYYGKAYHLNYSDCHIINPIPTQEYIKEIDYFRLKQKLQPVEVNKIQCVLGMAENFEGFKPDLEKLRSHKGRIWFIFSHFSDYERLPFLNYMDNAGVRKDEFLQPGAMAYLYEL